MSASLTVCDYYSRPLLRSYCLNRSLWLHVFLLSREETGIYVINVLLVLMKGVVVLGIAWYLMIWCINKGGPHFVSVFQPLQTVMVAIMAAIFLGDTLYIGG